MPTLNPGKNLPYDIAQLVGILGCGEAVNDFRLIAQEITDDGRFIHDLHQGTREQLPSLAAIFNGFRKRWARDGLTVTLEFDAP